MVVAVASKRAAEIKYSGLTYGSDERGVAEKTYIASRSKLDSLEDSNLVGHLVEKINYLKNYADSGETTVPAKCRVTLGADRDGYSFSIHWESRTVSPLPDSENKWVVGQWTHWMTGGLVFRGPFREDDRSVSLGNHDGWGVHT
jgi:hypothetical protein